MTLFLIQNFQFGVSQVIYSSFLGLWEHPYSTVTESDIISFGGIYPVGRDAWHLRMKSVIILTAPDFNNCNALESGYRF